MSGWRVVIAATLLALASSCRHAPLNQPLTKYDANQGFRYRRSAETEATTEVSLLLFLSGGGMRAAALSYGVLRELAATPVPGDPKGRRMLDEIEMISSVSGGSFTAAYFGLYHERIFSDYEERFLKRNVTAALLRRTVFPANWFGLASPYYGRSDLAADYYHHHLFDEATFGDLVRKGNRPFVLINATDMANGEQFSFSQIRFDLIGSDLSAYPLARAVAASSAVPFLLTPITLKNHAGAAGAVQSAFLPAEDPNNPAYDRGWSARRVMRSYTDASDRPFIHLVDGGLSDNLGLRAIMDASAVSGGIDGLAEKIGMPATKRLVVVIVNAAARRGREWSQREQVPGVFHSINQLGDIIGEQVNRHTIDSFKVQLREWRQKARARGEPGFDSADFYLVMVTLDELPPGELRDSLQNLPTSLDLPDNAVDHLVEVGGRLLRESREFKRLLGDLETGE